jgi:hypothetical protein
MESRRKITFHCVAQGSTRTMLPEFLGESRSRKACFSIIDSNLLLSVKCIQRRQQYIFCMPKDLTMCMRIIYKKEKGKEVGLFDSK